MRYPVYALVLLFLCLAAPMLRADAEGQKRSQAPDIYNFEHRLMPRWVHNTDGRLFTDLVDHEGKNTKALTAEVVSPEFASGLQIKTIVPGKAVLISFPEPERSLLCYHAIVAKTDTGYAYYTLEKADDVMDTGKVKAMYCSWVSDTARKNFGARDYTDAEAFVKEYLANQNPGDASITTHLPNRKAP